MTKDYFFDTDCLCAFLWVGEECILTHLYSGKIVIPMQVYYEIQRVPHLLSRVDSLKRNGDLTVESMLVGSSEYDDYVRMTTSPDVGMRIIGDGEAAGIAMAKHRNGILASNNMSDIPPYIKKYSIKHITTGDILVKALNDGLITESQGNTIWSDMLSKRRILPTTTFSEYLRNHQR